MFFFEQTDAVKVVLHHLFLLVGLADFIVVGGDTRNVVQHLAAFVCRHFREARNVALKHDVVAIRTSIGRPEKTVENLLRAVFAVEFVSGYWVIGSG